MIKALLGLLALAAFWDPASLLATPLVGGTARTQKDDRGELAVFNLFMRADADAKPGVQFYAKGRVVFNDETWISGGLICSPAGIRGGEFSIVGPFISSRPFHKAKPVKYIELVGSIGDPSRFFSPDQKATGYEPMDDATRKKLLAAGGFVIRVPVEGIALRTR